MTALLTALLLAQWQNGMTVKDEGVPRGQATGVNCTGAGVTCSLGLGGVWTLNATGGGGATLPTTTALLQGDGAGGAAAYAGASCTLPQLMQNLSASGAPTCFQLRLDQVANPTGDKTFTFPSGAKTLWEFSGATDYAFSIHGTGAFTGSGDLMHLHLQGTPGVAAGADVLHVEWEDTDARGLFLNGPSSASQAATIIGAVGVTGTVTATQFSGPLAGQANTAAALAADPVACGAGTYATDQTASGVLTCSTPPGTYTLPAASTTLGGVKMAADCSAGNHVASIGAGGELGCTADSGGALAAATATVLGGVKGNGTTTACSGTDKMTGWAADGTLACATDQTGGAGSVDLRGLVTSFGGF